MASVEPLSLRRKGLPVVPERTQPCHIILPPWFQKSPEEPGLEEEKDIDVLGVQQLVKSVSDGVSGNVSDCVSECPWQCSECCGDFLTEHLAASLALSPAVFLGVCLFASQMAAPVPWACCAVLAAAAAVVYAQRHSPQETPHVQYERLGSDVTLPCGTASWDAAVTWRVNGTDLAPDLLNGSQLVLRSLELGHGGLYACFHRDSWHLRHQVLLHVGLPPREPVLSCRSNTYPKGFYCSWHLPTPTYIPNTFNVTVLHGSKIMVCEKDPAVKNRCHIRYMHLFSTVKYKVSISVSNALGHNATAITFDEFTIVKPDPPENVVARPVPSNPRRLEVTWQTPSTWPDPESFPLKFFLRYRPLILDQWQHVELSDGTAHTITDAYAGKEYIIQVAAKDNEIGTWSDWSVAAHATPWTEEPRHLTTEAQAPETTTSTTSSLAPPPTTKICDPGELGSGGATSAPSFVSVPVTLALAAAATTASSLLIWLRHLHCPGIAECVEGRLSQRPASAWVLPLRQLLSLCSSEGAPVMGAALSQGALIAIICNGLVGFLLLLLWVILCWACHSRSANIDSLSESSPNSSPGPCPEKAPPPQKPSHEGSYLLQP
ncbi:hypothetical protein JEQ12_008889 [Ovis aries]|uniref:Ciliary neurotrophic factor receptor subunit alpha n=5 Tax=Caprinae TaxID=9963 RepID=A0A836AF03_SHEEP|nr:hypothetical protein JEQ12_008889 [Ovis aries]